MHRIFILHYKFSLFWLICEWLACPSSALCGGLKVAARRLPFAVPILKRLAVLRQTINSTDCANFWLYLEIVISFLLDGCRLKCIPIWQSIDERPFVNQIINSKFRSHQEQSICGCRFEVCSCALRHFVVE
jgi:hypothetical protein